MFNLYLVVVIFSWVFILLALAAFQAVRHEVSERRRK